MTRRVLLFRVWQVLVELRELQSNPNPDGVRMAVRLLEQLYHDLGAKRQIRTLSGTLERDLVKGVG